MKNTIFDKFFRCIAYLWFNRRLRQRHFIKSLNFSKVLQVKLYFFRITAGMSDLQRYPVKLLSGRRYPHLYSQRLSADVMHGADSCMERTLACGGLLHGADSCMEGTLAWRGLLHEADSPCSFNYFNTMLEINAML